MECECGCGAKGTVLDAINYAEAATERLRSLTDRHRGYIVVLEEDIREDDAENIVIALNMVKGVISVKPLVTEANDLLAQERAKYVVRNKVFDALQEL